MLYRKIGKTNYGPLICLFGVSRPTWEFFNHIETTLLPVKGRNIYLCSALISIEQWRFFSVPTYCDTRHAFIMVITEDPWHLNLLPSVLQSSCHYLFLRLRSVAARIRTPNVSLAGRMISSSVPPLRLPALQTGSVMYGVKILARWNWGSTHENKCILVFTISFFTV